MGSWLELWLALFNILTRSQSTISRGRHLLACSQFHSSSFKNIAWWYYKKKPQNSLIKFVLFWCSKFWLPAYYIQTYLLKLTFLSSPLCCIFDDEFPAIKVSHKRSTIIPSFDGWLPNHDVTMQVHKSSWTVICHDSWPHCCWSDHGGLQCCLAMGVMAVLLPRDGAFDLGLAVSVPLPIVTGIFVLLWFQSRLT